MEQSQQDRFKQIEAVLANHAEALKTLGAQLVELAAGHRALAENLNRLVEAMIGLKGGSCARQD